MRSRTFLALALSGIAGTMIVGSVGYRGRANACSPLAPFSRSSPIIDKEVDVPTNARVRVAYAAAVSVADDVRLERNDQPVAGTWAKVEAPYWEFTPAAPMEPNTRYGISDRYPGCRNSSAVCPRGDWSVWSSFTTTAGPDVTPPVFKGPIDAHCERKECNSSACCGPYSAWAIEFGHGITETLIHMYARASAPGWGPFEFQTWSEIPLGPMGSLYASGPPLPLLPAQPMTIELFACDLANNCTPGVTKLMVSAAGGGCQLLDPDTGRPLGGDGGGGCDLGPDHERAPAAIGLGLVGAAIMLAIQRKRRSRRI
jgi:hypothetical protein